jgi:acetyl esterase/lipase/SAM-dependent methyltransferase
MKRLRLLSALCGFLAATLVLAQEKSVRPGINDPFKDPDVKMYIGTFEGESREIFTARKEILAACKLKPGLAVADIGAGTGLFTRLIAGEVGQAGKVYAVDIAAKFLDHIKKTCQEANITNVETIQCTDRSAELPEGSIDVAFICDTYHHFEFPQRTMGTIHKALRPGGQLILVDFHRILGKSRLFILVHVRAGQEVFEREVTEAGFKKIGEEKIPGLQENYFVRFQKVDSVGAQQPLVVPLWPCKAPEEPGTIGAEKVAMSPKLDKKQVEVTESTRMVTNVTNPTISIYRPAKEKDTGTAVLICPGGGYWNLYWELEGEEVAAWLNSIGVTGIILKYRVPRRPDEIKGEPARRPLQDAQRAVSLVRSRAKEWGIDPKRIGMVGFSAGGHLVMATATSFEKRTYEPIDDIDKVSCRPDFAIPVYSGYLKAKDKDELAPGLSVPKGTPPVFLVHGGEDLVSTPEHSVFMYLALKRAGVPAELHIYASTAHDFGVRPSERPYGGWTEACAKWMRQQRFLR